jgi:hypothetical protein
MNLFDWLPDRDYHMLRSEVSGVTVRSAGSSWQLDRPDLPPRFRLAVKWYRVMPDPNIEQLFENWITQLF